MNKLFLKEVTPEHVIYFYQPEGKGEKGIIAMLIGNEPEVETLASEDNSIGQYAFKAKKAIKEIVKEKNFPLEFVQAWN